MTIRHLVVIGGGPNVFIHYGVIKKLVKENFIKYNELKSIHATSCGCVASLILLLNPNWNDIDNYLIDRPWEKLFYIKPQQLIRAISSLGVYDETIFTEIYAPIMKVNNLSLDITLKELYEFTNVEFNMYTTIYPEVESVVLNHKNNPDLKLFTAVTMSCSIPMVFKPVKYNNKLYFDGALYKNYPLKDCIENTENLDKDEILGIKQAKKSKIEEKEEKEDADIENEPDVLENLDLFKMIGNIIGKLLHNINKETYQNISIKNEIELQFKFADFTFWKEVITLKEKRKELIEEGEKNAEDFLIKVNKRD